MTNLDHWAAMARTFHTLVHAPGVAEGTPPSPRELDDWACGIEVGDGVREAAQFALHLWNSDPNVWGCGSFNLRKAVGTWDSEQRAAFFCWVVDGMRFF